MAVVGHYEIIEKLSEGQKRTVYRVLNKEDNQKYVLKLLNSEYSDPIEIYKLKHEYEILNDLKIKNVVQAFEVDTIEGLQALVVEDFGAISLKEYISKHNIDGSTFLKMAKSIVGIMCEVHAKEIIHNDLNPTNILINEETYNIKISDFGISERYSGFMMKNETSAGVVGTIEYISPEQTGRIRKNVDFRSDIYSLGITFYQLITGELPFNFKDVVELIHAHIAVNPIAPHEIDSEIPILISNMILKMIEKDPDLRYQSFAALFEDLRKAIDLDNGNGRITSFELGKKEEHRRFIIPNKLYGRSDVVTKINDSLDRIKLGSNEALFINGEFGSGKSYILNHLEELVGCTGFNVVYGSFDKRENGETYSLFANVLNNYIEHVLSGSDDEIIEFKNILADLAGPNTKYLIERVPRLRSFLGEPKGVQVVNPFEQASKNKNFISGLVRIISSNKKPLVIVLDDLHKSDYATIDIIDYILNDKSIRNLLILASFEENSNSANLSEFIEERKSSIDFQCVSLGLFSLNDISELIKKLFNLNSIERETLSKIILQKTNGNPYFAFEMLKDAYKAKDIFFNGDTGSWEVMQSNLIDYEVYTNVLTSLMTKISELSDEASELLSIASCIGVKFDLETLTALSEITMEHSKILIAEAIDKEIIISSDYRSKYLKFVVNESVIFKFSHENVREIYFDKLASEDQVRMSYRIGRIGLEQTANIEEIDINVVEHLNFSRTLVKDREERIHLLKLNYYIGARAKDLNNYKIASKFFTAALELADDEFFHEDYRFYFNVYLNKAETEYLNKNFETAEFYFDHLIQLINDPIDIAQVYKTKMSLYVNQGKTEETLRVAKKALKNLGEDLSIEPNAFLVAKELLTFKLNPRIKGPKDLESLKMMTDEKHILIMEILMVLISVSYLMSKSLFIYIIMRVLNYSVKYGHSVSSPYAYAIYGLLEVVGFKNPEKGLEYGKVGIKIADEFGNFEIINKCNFTVGFFLNHWTNHSSENLKYIEKAIDNGYYAGDMVFYAYSVAAYILTLVETEENLDYILGEIEKYYDSIKGMKVDDVFNFLQAIKQYILCLKMKTKSYASFDDNDFDQDEFENRLKSSNMPSIYAIYEVFRIKTLYLFDRYEEAVEICNRLKPYFNELMGLMPSAHLKMYHSLALLKLVEQNPQKQTEYIKVVKKNQRKLYKWMQNAPMNFTHKYKLVEAEVNNVLGLSWNAEEMYLEAIREAQANKYIQEEALACELLAEFYKKVGKHRVRKVYLKDAYYLYSNWGSTAIKEFFRTKYPEIIFEDGNKNTHETFNTVSKTSESSIRKFDYLTITKASQALSEEIMVDELLRKLVSIILENAGADTVVLMIKKEILTIEAMGSANLGIEIIENRIVKNSGLVPEKIINYVLRTEEELISNNINSSIKLRKDPYFNEKSPKSVLCTPILNKGELYGILYLENNLIDGAFGEDNVEVLNILSSQFASSYENARLYQNLAESETELKRHKENLEIIVDERTHELSFVNTQIKNLLDNAGQGFLSFNRSGIISNEYSKECYKIFQYDISDLSYGTLVGKYISESEEILIDRIVEKIFLSKNEFEANVYISLLPKEIVVSSRIISVEYRLTEVALDKKVMVILTDATDKKALEIAREEEKRNLKMIVKTVKYQNNFRKSLEDYKQFYSKDIFEMFNVRADFTSAMLEFYRMIHTFKGEFAQWSMNRTEKTLHEIESLIHMKLGNESFGYKEAVEFIEDIDFERIIEEDISLIKEYVGEAFLHSTEKLEIDKNTIIALENRLDAITNLDEIKQVIHDVKKSRFTNFKEVFHQFDEYLKNLALGLDKKVNDIIIIGDDILVDKSHYHAFIRATIHIFRNMLDYGIELPNDRVSAGKDELGSIVCQVERIDSRRMKVLLKDDGIGINTIKIKQVLENRKVLSENEILNMTDHEIHQYIFKDRISVKKEVTKLSGRGLGLSAIKKEIDKLGGSIKVYSEVNEGTTFEIELPILDE